MKVDRVMKILKLHDIERLDIHNDGEKLEQLYTWVDTVELSRPKKNMSRDFSDAGET